MPRDDGSIPPMTVPVLPWKQTFKPGDTVRVIGGKNDIDGFGGSTGVVVYADSLSGQVMVGLDEDPDGMGWNFAPGELRPVTA